MKVVIPITLIILLTLNVFSNLFAQTAQLPASQEDAEIIFLGVNHFKNPNADEYNADVPDMLAPEKQKEIKAVIDSLSQFHPTDIAVEQTLDHQNNLDSLYRSWREGRRELGRNEIEQLGFRLANRSDLNTLHAVDYKNHGWIFDQVKSFAQKHDPEFLDYFSNWGNQLSTKMNQVLRERSFREALLYLNSSKMLNKIHSAYPRIATVGNDSVDVGARLVSNWYDRNIHIFSNIAHMVEPGDRLIVIFGAGHGQIIRRLIADNPTMTLVDPSSYLD